MQKKQQAKTKQIVFNLEDFRFVGNHVLVKGIKAGSASGWAKPKQKDDKPEFGKVLSVGEQCQYNIKEGDIILFGKYVSEATDNNGETFYFIRDEDIKGVKIK